MEISWFVNLGCLRMLNILGTILYFKDLLKRVVIGYAIEYLTTIGGMITAPVPLAP